ncbi:MAG: hypothetical protein DHS20C02_06770 [Micavibrio sp.]|nr:MAG: hypothetical protein DHS20C02_06770 [Micavibrio sp.]
MTKQSKRYSGDTGLLRLRPHNDDRKNYENSESAEQTEECVFMILNQIVKRNFCAVFKEPHPLAKK